MAAEIISRKGTPTPSLTKTACAPTGSIFGQSNVSMVRTELLLQCPSLHLLTLLEALFPKWVTALTTHKKVLAIFTNLFLNWKITLCSFCLLHGLEGKPLSG